MDEQAADPVKIIEQCSARILHPCITSYREFFTTLADTTREIFRADYVLIWDGNPAIKKAIAVEQSPNRTQVIPDRWMDIGLLESRRAFKEATIEIHLKIQSVDCEKLGYDGAVLARNNYNHLISIPILDPIRSQAAVGLIELFFAEQPTETPAMDERVLRWLARAVGRALDYLALRVEANIRKAVDECGAKHLGMSPFFTCVAEVIRTVCGCSHVTLYRHDDKGNWLNVERSTTVAYSIAEPKPDASQGGSFDEAAYLACVRGKSPFVQAKTQTDGPSKLRIAVPILAPSGMVVGVLKLAGALSSEDPFLASSWNTRVVQSFAKAIAPTLDRRWMLSDGLLLRHVITSIAVAVSAEENLDDFLNKTLATLGDELRASMGSIYLLEDGPSGPELVMRAGIGPDRALIGKARYKIGEGITGDIARRREILNFKTREERKDYKGRKGKYSSELAYPSLEGKGPAFLGVPILLGERLLGVWKIEYIETSPEHPDPYFTSEDERIAQLLSLFLAYAIENGRHRALARNLRTFAASSLAIERAHTEDQAVLEFMDGLGRSSFDSAMISLLGPDNMIRGKWFSGNRFEKIYDKTVRKLDGPDILAVVLRSGEATLIADSKTDIRCDPPAIADSGLIAQYILPLAAGDERIGTVQIDLGERPTVDADQQHLLNSFAGHLTITISRIRATLQLDELTQQVTRSARFIVAEELSGWAVHSFTRRLDGVLKQLRRDLEQPEIGSNRILHETLTKWKNTLEQSAEELAAALSSVKAGGPEQGPYSADVPTEIQNTINQWYAYLKYHNVRIVANKKATRDTIDLAPHAFRELLSVLIVNAVEAFAREIQIETRDMSNAEAPTHNFLGDAVCIDVTDDGTGLGDITEPDQFFDSTYTTKKKIGTGLGLFIARRLAKRGGGELTIAAEQPSKGARFRVILPAHRKPEAKNNKP